MFDGLVEALVQSRTKRQLVERRGHYRVPCRRSINILLKDQATGGHMLNLSRLGMKVRVHDRLPSNEEMRLLVSGKKSGGSRFVASVDLVCKLIWCKFSKLHRAYDAGIAYLPAPGVDLEYVDAFFRHELGLENPETFQKRASRRIDTDLDVTCFTRDGRVSLGSIRDLNMGGARFEGALRVDEGEEVRLRIENTGRSEPLYCIGNVARCRPSSRAEWFEIGVQFTDVGNRAELQRILGREMRDNS